MSWSSQRKKEGKELLVISREVVYRQVFVDSHRVFVTDPVTDCYSTCSLIQSANGSSDHQIRGCRVFWPSLLGAFF